MSVFNSTIQMTWPVKSHWKFLRGLKLCVFVFVVSLELKIFNNSILFYNTEEKKKHAEVKINYKHYLQMLLKLCATRHSKCKWSRGRKRHTWRVANSCLELCQHFPHSSAPGLPALLSLPQADELLLWEYHHWPEKPAVLGPEADSAGKFWRSGDWC